MRNASYRLWAWGFILAMAGTIRAGSEPSLEDTTCVPPKEGVDYFNVKAATAIEAAEAWSKEHPEDVAGYFVLGRLHAMACMSGETVALAEPVKAGVLPRLSSGKHVLLWRTIKVDAALNREHIPKAIKAFRFATNIAPESAENHFGLATMPLEAGGELENLPHGATMTNDIERRSFEEALKGLGDQNPAVRTEATKKLIERMPANFEALSQLKADDAGAAARIKDAVRTYCELDVLKEFRLAYKISVEGDLLTTKFVDREALSYWAAVQMQVIVRDHPEVADEVEQSKWAATITKLKSVPGVLART